MVRKLAIIFLLIILLFNLYSPVLGATLGYGSIADYYPNVFVFQNGNQINSVTYPESDSSAIDYSCSFIGSVNGGVVYFVALVENTANYTGYISYSSTPRPSVTNYTNITYYLFYASGSIWNNFSTLGPNETFNFSESSWLSNDTPFPFVGSNVLIRYNNQGAYVFSNYVSSTLRITSSTSDIENAGIDYPIIFDNAQINIGLDNLKSYVAVSYQSSNDSTTWSDMSYVILTNNSVLYNDSTHSFYIKLQNLIDRDLDVGDKIKIEYGWTTLDRLGNPHSYSFYQVFTRSTAYVDGSSYEPAPIPGSGGSSGFDDISNSLTEQTQAINDQTNAIHEQTQAINQQTDSINNQTNVISGMNDQLFDENVTEPNSIGVNDTTQNNTSDLSGLYNSFSGAWHSFDGTKAFDLELPNHTHWSIALPSVQIHDFFDNHTALLTLWNALWWSMLGGYVVFDFKKMYNKFKTGELRTVMSNSSPIDNVVKEILR